VQQILRSPQIDQKVMREAFARLYEQQTESQYGYEQQEYILCRDVG
jgi:hypothetical protein